VHRLPRPDELAAIGARFRELVDLARSNTIVMDRFAGTAVLTSRHAEEVGVLGVVARASGLTLDARHAHPFIEAPAGFRPARRDAGDVLARFDVRCDEVETSLLILAGLVKHDGPLSASEPDPVTGGEGHGSGIVEGWRGTIVHRVEVDSAGMLTRVKIVDPSFLTWPALSVALENTIVPDFLLPTRASICPTRGTTCEECAPDRRFCLSSHDVLINPLD
jgi:Ni,Fe-hydrogenase III large subunit